MKLDMEETCDRFRKLDDLPLYRIGRVIARFPVKTCLRLYEAALRTWADGKNRR